MLINTIISRDVKQGVPFGQRVQGYRFKQLLTKANASHDLRLVGVFNESELNTTKMA